MAKEASEVSHGIGRVIVGVHGSPGSLQALRFAVETARRFDCVLHPVIAWQAPGGDSAYRHFPAYLVDEWELDAERRLLTAFDEGLGGVPMDLRIHPLVVRGRVGPTLVEIADRENDLLVVGRSQRAWWHRAWYGSPTRHALARARCSVICVPPSRLVAELRGHGWRLRSV